VLLLLCYWNNLSEELNLPVQLILAIYSFYLLKEMYDVHICNAYAVCVLLYVMYGLCLTRKYAAFTSSLTRRIPCTCCPQRVGHFVFHITVGNKLLHIRGPICLNSIVSGGRGGQSSSRVVSVMAVGQLWPENRQFGTPAQLTTQIPHIFLPSESFVRNE